MKVKRIVFACAVVLVVSTFGAPAQQAKPQYGEWGYDISGADKTTKPGDDFFRYANGNWIDKTEIPADKPGYSLRLAMTDLTEQRLHEMMEAASAAEREPTTLDGKVGASQVVHGRSTHQ
jgi:putative endopeptidase